VPDAAAISSVVALVRDRIWQECDPGAILAAGSGEADASQVVAALARGFVADAGIALPAETLEQVVAEVVASTLGHGPLQRLLDDPAVSEVMVNGPGEVFVERSGRIQRVDVAFDDTDHVLRVVDRILAPVGRRVDALSPLVDARLPDGSRVHVAIPPVAVDGPLVTIRRFVRVAAGLDDLQALGTFDASTATLLRRLVTTRSNVLVSGGTSTGKTTLLAATLAAAAPDDRVVLIEDAAELPLEHPHRVRLEARPASSGTAPPIDLRDLLRAALRMRPDRIIVGEVRGAEAFDLLQALNTGHRGCWSTIHANGCEDALLRLESMALCAGTGVPQPVMRTQVARAVDHVVQLARDADGSRRVVQVAAVDEGPAGGWQARLVDA
jgi:pilus assembly protein CpaF